jgi:hypothetical protein
LNSTDGLTARRPLTNDAAVAIEQRTQFEVKSQLKPMSASSNPI